jgi:hypothetical protein
MRASLRQLVLAAVDRLTAQELIHLDSTPGIAGWVRDREGQLFPRAVELPRRTPTLSAAWIEALPDYSDVAQQLTNDEVISAHLNQMVGTSMEAGGPMTVTQILHQLIYTTITDEAFSSSPEKAFAHAWAELDKFFNASSFPFVTLVPIPMLRLPVTPVSLDSNLVLDQFTEAEVNQCAGTGLLRPEGWGIPWISGAYAYGARRYGSSTSRGVIRTCRRRRARPNVDDQQLAAPCPHTAAAIRPPRG